MVNGEYFTRFKTKISPWKTLAEALHWNNTSTDVCFHQLYRKKQALFD